ncbi:imidazole glycerol phosphate synthase subunit HisH [Halomonas piscis]|uniref:Imidazole glycerol phosphate synthase subunit HisH n=1 Tax=Halomonas piscis TaxID=3031727 RepID=A0ABY9Z0M3_9GAMM|nr:imidazole glycerol phosphate synthase subunit HisH [Halomonas piscis]WNK20684.1 imidazole glycerol phosphate synthase subunit HisH [Halomonas piscis]
MTIAVIDYGMGNLHSVAKALEHVTHENVIITRDSRCILGATRLVLPGQGAIRDCMGELERSELRGLVEDVIQRQTKPLLGICVGQQMLLEHSEESGGVSCLGAFRGEVKRFPDAMRDHNGARMKVPHMGWNLVDQRREHPLWEGIDSHEHFYFVHGYYAKAADEADVFGTIQYGHISAHVAMGHGSTFAVQFHPEKSSRAGLKLLENFVTWSP